jgi:hypothetical protein
METNNMHIINGRSIGMHPLKIRIEKLSKIAAEKKIGVGWENMGSHYEVYIENEARQRIWEEVVLTKGIPTIKKISSFWDILEKEMEKY